jgi:hypothetical protein
MIPDEAFHFQTNVSDKGGCVAVAYEASGSLLQEDAEGEMLDNLHSEQANEVETR